MANAVSNEVRELREELAQIRSILTPSAAAPGAATKIRVHVERCVGERKPYLLVFKGLQEKRFRLSATRTAIALTLLLDLEQRGHGLLGILSPREVALQVLNIISHDTADSARAQEQIRVGFYRFAAFWHVEAAGLLPAHYDSAGERLVMEDGAGPLEIDIFSSDPTIEDALPKLGRPPMLDRLRRDRFLFVPAGGSGSERLLTEVYSAPGKLHVSLAYARPQLITVPPLLIQKYAKSPDAIIRHGLMHKRLSEGTLTFCEIIPEQSLETLTEQRPDGTYSYFPGMTAAEVGAHLRFLEGMLLAGTGYRLILTRCEIPFYVGTYDAQTFGLAAFFRLPESGEQSAWSSFAAWGIDIARMAEKTVFEWLLNHPSTTTDTEAIVSLLRKAYARLNLDDAELTESFPAEGL